MADLLGSTPATFQVWPSATPEFSELLNSHLCGSDIQKQHLTAGPIAPVVISSVSNVIVSGRSTVGSQDMIYLLDDPVPLYVDNYLREGKAPADVYLPPSQVRTVSGVSVLLTHWNSSIYGHWLMEGLPKLFLLRRHLSDIPAPIKIVTPSSCGSFVKSWADLLLPGVDVDVYDADHESLHCEHLLLPSWLGSRTHEYHPLLSTMVDEFSTRQPAHGTDGRIYVSREKENPHRTFANKAEIEEIAVDAGFRIVVPERLPVHEQFRVFASASTIVGPFGSSMHNTLFSPIFSTVLCLNWINAIQSKIAHLRRQRVGYLLSQDGPVAYDRNNPTLREFTIDKDEFRRTVDSL